MDALQPLYRESWAANQEILAASASVIETLRAEGIDTVLLRGAGLALSCYPRIGLRPIGDVDMLVRPEHAARARYLLHGAGFQANVVYPGNALSCVHSLNFERRRLSIDLHWHALRECQRAVDDVGLWAHARTVRIGNTVTHVASPTDHLILVCAHGLRWTATRSVHWLADASTLLAGSGEDAVDWDRLTEVTQARGLVLSMRRALEFLARELDAPVPAAVLARFAAAPTSWRERVEHTALMRPPSLGRGLIRQWCEHTRRYAPQPWPLRLARFPEHLRSAWGVATVADVPLTALRKIAARLSDPSSRHT